MSNRNALPCVPFRFKILPHKSINMHKQRDKLFALPVHLLRQVFNGFLRFYVILDGFVWISWIPGARGRIPCGILWRTVGSESGPY